MHQSGLPKKSVAQEFLRALKAQSAQASEEDGKVTARQHEAHAELIELKLQRGDYEG